MIEKLGVDNMFAAAMVGIVAIMILPLPTILMDLFLAFSISCAMIVFILALNIDKPLQLSSFPAIILILTLMRLGLNIASTRLILSKGDQGADAVSKVIKSFGDFVVGGNVVIGIIVFLILVIINFVVITKGTGRIAEVSARFTLDAMPGKQMAIDADLAAGAISEAEARDRREEIQIESNFFGAMDGAAKFVKGDAIAGLIITAVNIIGGLIIGTMQQDMSAAEAAVTYTQLTIGDGLASQVPSLLTSVAAGIIVTRTTTPGPLGNTVTKEIFQSKRPLYLSAMFLAGLGVVPGMPHVPFFILAAILTAVAYNTKEDAKDDEVEGEPGDMLDTAEREREELENLLPVDLLEIEVGYELVPMVDAQRDGALLKRISGIRKQVATELGLVVPPIHMRDNLQLRPGEYRVMLSGSEIGRGELDVNSVMAMNPAGGIPAGLDGVGTVEPAFGLPAKWIAGGDSERAEMMGYTVVDPSTVAATHLGELLSCNAYNLLGRREFQDLLTLHGRDNAKVIEELIPTVLSPGQVIKVLRNLLLERVSIRDFRTILEGLADVGEEIKDAEQLTEIVRQRLSKQITGQFVDFNGTISAVVLAPNAENVFRRLQNPAHGGVLDPSDLQTVLDQFQETANNLPPSDGMPVIVVAADIRRSVMMFVSRHMPGMSVISFREIEAQANLQTIGVVGGGPQDQMRGAA
jgi:flagellar biosynthesis protein FlhA